MALRLGLGFDGMVEPSEEIEDSDGSVRRASDDIARWLLASLGHELLRGEQLRGQCGRTGREP